MRSSLIMLASGLMLVLVSQASAQTDNPPFFSSASVGYEAQVTTGFSGVAMDAHVTVSSDRKYATIGGQFTNSGPPVLTPFQTTTPAGNGTVGSTTSTPATAAPAGAALGRPAGTVSSPSVLDKPGITLVARLEP
jgi:hypothetical protein